MLRFDKLILAELDSIASVLMKIIRKRLEKDYKCMINKAI